MSLGRTVELEPILGFRFACRPDCGLCCFASPALNPTEARRLISIEPGFRPTDDRPPQIPSRPNGGACTFLRHCRCRVHDARPGPCAEFPLSAHLGERLQLSVVLSCPGVGLDGLRSTARSEASLVDPSLSAEFAAVCKAIDAVGEPEWTQATRSWKRASAAALRRSGADRDPVGHLRATLLNDLPTPDADSLAAVPLPEESEGLDRLPLFFDERFGRVALSGDSDRVHLIALREEGGVDRRLASFPYPEAVPELSTEGLELLRDYLRYVVGRDAFIGAALDRLPSGGVPSLLEIGREDLREIAAAVVSRSIYRSWLHGASAETLGPDEIGDGIRATDQDYLDRPTVGRWV